MPNVYVPTYTEHAGEYDMGYYDNQGTFHPNPNAKEPAMPPPSHLRDSDAADGVPLSNEFHQQPSSPQNGQTDFTRTQVENVDEAYSNRQANSESRH